MSNVLARNPIVIDTVGSFSQAMPLFVRKVEWFNPTSTAHTFTLQSDGATKLEGQCESANVSQVWSFPSDSPLVLSATGWGVTVLGSGKLYLWY